MNELLEIEKIKRMKYKYFRALDTNQWDLIAECFTEDCHSQYDSGNYTFDGRDNIIKFLEEGLGGDNILSLHQAHHPEIDIVDENHATGIWYLQDIVLRLKEKFSLRGAGFYRDEYRREEGQWKHSVIGYDRTYEEVEPRSDNIVVNNNMFTRNKI
jgi:hypothetical protein